MSSEPLHLLSGETLTPALLSTNRTTVLYVWGDWCHICAYTSPTISRLAEDGIPVVGIALHSGADEHIRTYMSENISTFLRSTTTTDAWRKMESFRYPEHYPD